MEVIICPNPTDTGVLAAAKIAQVTSRVGPEVVLGVATGSSPVATYRALTALVEVGQLDLSQAYAFALDEYVGLPHGHAESYAEVIRRQVTEPLRMDPSRVHCPDGFAADLEAAGPAYEAAIAAAGGVDIQLLGVGANGHIGFNEPTSSLASRTRIKTLAAVTREANRRFFADDEAVPTHCMTQGLGTIMAARQVLLVAQGEEKAAAIAGLVEGPVSASCPGSVLQFHQYATVIVDESAASQLRLAQHYRDTYAGKPDWQRFEQ